MDVDAEAIMTGRGCIMGQSGSGKSFLAGVLLEELCRLKLPFCVIDTEGEYSALKDIAPVIVVAEEGGDIGFGVDFDELFLRSIDNDIPVVIDVSDTEDKKGAVYRSLQALYSVESRMRRPYLVVIEEADKFAPQVVRKDHNIIEELSVRGRKRGVGLLVATQRPANISKNVLSQCSYGFVGKLTIENDLNAIRILFGRKQALENITRLGTGEFVSFGLGIENSFRIKERVTKHAGATPEIGGEVKRGRIESVLKDLRGIGNTGSNRSGRKSAVKSQSVRALHMGFGLDDAKGYAQKIAKKRFLLFGNATERIDSVELKYMPIGQCSFRIPTRHKNEYLEYYALFDLKYRLVRIDKGIRTLDVETAGKGRTVNYMPWLRKEPLDTEEVKLVKEDMIEGALSERKAFSLIRRRFPEAMPSGFLQALMPIYIITLKNGNRIREFVLDGLFGRQVNFK